MASSASTPGQLSLARFAFNIYGALGSNELQKPLKSPDAIKHLQKSSKKLMYSCEREITCLSQLTHPLGRLMSSYSEIQGQAPAHHVVIGGKNYLKLLALNADQSAVVADVNIVDPASQTQSRLLSSLKLFNVNTVKCYGDMVACGLTNGSVNIYQVASSGKSRLAYKLEDHKRVVNSVDFTDHEQVLFSGSQDGTVKLWDLRTFSPKPVLKLSASQHSDPVRSCEYSRHSRVRGKMTVLSVHDSGSLCKFDLRFPTSSSSSTLLPERKWTFHTGPALSLHIHPEAEYVLTGGRDKKICVWNYSDASLLSNSPETTLNTYGPVMKIRWSNTPSQDVQRNTSNFDISEVYTNSTLSLFDYDFACLYLNDDPTITVFNLRRKYVPKEIITTTSHKPFQNFIWAEGPAPSQRKLWTLTKSNIFVSYNLSSGDDGLLNVTRPLEDLPSIATTWQNGFADLSFVTQDSRDYGFLTAELSDIDTEVHERSNSEDYMRIEEERPFEHHSSAVSLESPNAYTKTPMGLLPNPSNLLYQKTQNNSSPKDRPQLIRQSTAYAGNKSPSPIPHGRQSMAETFGSLMRPSLPRNSSQSTQESESPLFMQLPHAQLNNGKKASFGGPSPYVVAVNVPIPLGDEAVFEILANEYHISIPDGFELADVCQMNARLAASVQRYRDCQVWRLLTVALEQEEFEQYMANYLEYEDHTMEEIAQQKEQNPQEELKSLLSDLGNFVGSYNSNSTLTTNYGSMPKGSESASSAHNISLSEITRESSRGPGSFGGSKSASATSLLEPTQPYMASTSPSISRANSLQARKRPILHGPRAYSGTSEQENAIIDDEDEEGHSEHSHLPTKRDPAQAFRSAVSRKSSAIDIRASRYPSFSSHIASPDLAGDEGSPLLYSRKLPVRSQVSSSFSGTQQSWAIPKATQDLDNENLNAVSTATASVASGFMAIGSGSFTGAPGSVRNRPSMLSLKGSPSNFRGSFGSSRSGGVLGTKQGVAHHLERVDESSLHSGEPRRSELTKAFKDENKANEEADVPVSDMPWNTLNMLKKAIDYAMDQGDVIMCSTLILLFYKPFHKHFPKQVLSNNSCLECLGMYIETLRKRRLFTNAVKVVKEAPSELQYDLSVYASKEVSMRFYCCWCNKLMVNELSKGKFGALSENFGYWYCDECHRKQLNCIYCNVPCKGLTVVVSLACGHRGHFGCLQEWFIQDQNTECPGGCDGLVEV